jgi:hypothetical protein
MALHNPGRPKRVSLIFSFFAESYTVSMVNQFDHRNDDPQSAWERKQVSCSTSHKV